MYLSYNLRITEQAWVKLIKIIMTNLKPTFKIIQVTRLKILFFYRILIMCSIFYDYLQMEIKQLGPTSS